MKTTYTSHADVPQWIETKSRWQAYGFKLSNPDAEPVAKLHVEVRRYRKKKRETYNLYNFDQVEEISGDAAKLRREQFQRFYYADWSESPEADIWQEVHRAAEDAIRWSIHQEAVQRLPDMEAAARRLADDTAIRAGRMPSNLLIPMSPLDVQREIADRARVKMNSAIMKILIGYRVQIQPPDDAVSIKDRIISSLLGE